jgi:uncharacterized protein (TIGR03118 family)
MFSNITNITYTDYDFSKLSTKFIIDPEIASMIKSNLGYYDCQDYNQPCYIEQNIINRAKPKMITSSVVGFAGYYDPLLLQPWSIAIFGDKIYVACSQTATISIYNLLGEPVSPVMKIFGEYGNLLSPTGLCINTNLSSFNFKLGNTCASCTILSVTKNGTINGYSSIINVNCFNTIIDNSDNNSFYTGCCLSYLNNSEIFCAADFYNNNVDIFDKNFNRLTYRFIDQDTSNSIPNNYSVYNIKNINGMIYLLYSIIDKDQISTGNIEVFENDSGYISIFYPNGVFYKRLVSNYMLNCPYDIVLCPAKFGYPSGTYLVSNYGDGTISIFSNDGVFIDKMRDSDYNIIYISNLKSLCIKNYTDRINSSYYINGIDGDGVLNETLYWSATINNIQDGALGIIKSI